MSIAEHAGETSIKKVAVLGTGTIGLPVARNLKTAGFNVTAWNRTAGKAEVLRSHGIAVAGSAVEAVRNAEVVITVLTDGDAVAGVIKDAAEGLSPGALWLQLSTVGIESAQALHALAEELGLVFYDAPVQGTRQPAENGKLVILASGPLERRSELSSLFAAISQRVVWVSPDAGDGSKLKLVLNAFVLTLTHAIAESFSLAKALGIDATLITDVVDGGPLDSGYFKSKAGAIVSGNFDASFTVANATKDAKLVAAAANAAGLHLDLAIAGLQRFRRAGARGHADKDFAASYLAGNLLEDGLQAPSGNAHG